MPGIYEVIYIDGGGGIDVNILLFIRLDNLCKDGQSLEWNREQLLKNICLKDIERRRGSAKSVGSPDSLDKR